MAECGRGGMKRAIGLLSLLVVSTASVRVYAQDGGELERSKRYFEQGKRAIEDGRFLVAIAALEEAQRLASRPSTKFGLATALRLQYVVDKEPTKLLRAAVLFRQVVLEAPEDDERRGKAAVLLADLEPELARIDEQRQREGKGTVAETEGEGAVLQAKTQLLVSSVANGSVITIDGGKARSAPLVVEVTPGSHRVRGDAPGHFADEREVVAVEGRLVDIEFVLRAKPGVIVFRVTPGARITVDDRLVGETPVANGIAVAAGTYSVVLTRRGHGFHAAEVTVPPDGTVVVSAALPRTTQRLVSYWLASGTVAAAAAGVATSWLAMAARSRAEDIEARRRAGSALMPDEVVAHDDDVGRHNSLVAASYVVWAGAAALGIAAGLAYFADLPAPQGQHPVLAPMVGEGVVGVTYSSVLDIP